MEDEMSIASNREGWGHCKKCGCWSYFLSTYSEMCPICRDKQNGANKIRQKTKKNT